MVSSNKVRRRVLLLAFLVSLVIFYPILFNGNSFAAEVGDFTIALSTSSPPPSSTITASMSVYVGNNQLAGYDLTWTFNPAVLQVSKVQGGTTTGFTSITDSSIDNTNGEVHLVHFSTTYGTGAVNFALITFNVVGTVGSSTIFTLAVTDLGDPDFNQIAEGTRGLVGPATVTVVDATPPDTNITSKPPALSNSKAANLSFTSTEEGSTFECQLDSGNYASCTSPKDYTGLSDGLHTFSVRATDPAGNTDLSPASYAWTVDTTAPATTATPAGGLYNSAQSVTLAANETATIYYTTDGSTPTTASAVYSSSLNIAETTTIKFFARDNAGNSEAVKTETYTITLITLVGLTISGQNRDILTGKSQDFIATGIYSDQTSRDVTQSASWLSSATAVGTIAAGKFEALTAGQTVISASLQSITSNGLDITVGYCGDVNSDNLTNVIDAMFVAQYKLDVRSANELKLAFADVDLNGDADIVDAMKIAQFAVDIIQQLCVE